MTDWASAVLSKKHAPMGPSEPKGPSESLPTPKQPKPAPSLTDLDTNIPASTPLLPDRPSLVYLPTEIRLEIWSYLLELNKVPKSYGYTRNSEEFEGQEPVAKTPTYTRHGPVCVSKEISAEYRQAYYEHTRFFFHINSTNAFEALPQLAERPRWRPSDSDLFEKHVSSFPNFWNAPDKLLSSVRHCVLYIEIGEIASAPYSAHCVSRIIRAKTSVPEERRVASEMKTFNSLAAMKEQDDNFDTNLVDSIRTLIRDMPQLRSIQLVWNLDVELPAKRRMRFSRQSNTNWNFQTLGEPFVIPLQAKRPLRRFEVKVGDKWEDTMLKGERREGGEWVVWSP